MALRFQTGCISSHANAVGIHAGTRDCLDGLVVSSRNSTTMATTAVAVAMTWDGRNRKKKERKSEKSRSSQ